MREGGRAVGVHGGEGEDGHEELAFALLGVEVAEDGEGEEDGCELLGMGLCEFLSFVVCGRGSCLRR